MRHLTKCLTAAALAGATVAADACTSWVIHSSVSKSGRMIVQKCRDSHRNRLDADIRIAPNGWRWMRIGSAKYAPNFGMNEKGVAITMNDGDKTDIRHPGGERTGMSAAMTIRMVATHCANAREAVDMILSTGRNGRKMGSNATYFIADPKEAFMIDLAHGYAEVTQITGGIAVISNTWHLPGGEEVSTKPIQGGRSDRAREANVRAALRKRQLDGKYTVRGCIDVARLKSGKTFKTYYPFRKFKTTGGSLGATCFELDPEFPAYLSYAYLGLGPQQFTIFLPVPMSLDKLPEKVGDGSWAQMTYDLWDYFGPRTENEAAHPYLADFAKLEDKFLVEVEGARKAAHTLLKQGKNDEAAKLLNGLFDRQFAEADALLTRVHRESGAAEAAANKTSSKGNK